MSETTILSRVFGALLREARQSAGISQEELAARADLHRTYVSLLERGVKGPTLDTLFRLCHALAQRPEDFVEELRRRVSGEEAGGSPGDASAWRRRGE